MSRIRMIVQKEILLIARSKFFVLPLLVNLFCWGYLILSYELQSVHYEETAAVFYRGFIWMLLLNLLIMGLISIYIASKDRESHFEQLIVTYQVKNAEWLLGKWIVAQAYGLIVTFFTILIQAIWLLSGEMSLSEWSQHLLYTGIQMEGAFFFIISFGFLCGTWIKNMFAYLSIPIILLLSLTLPFDNVGTALNFDNPRIHLLTPFDYMFIETPYEGIWGIHRVFESTTLHQSIVFIMGVIVLLCTLALYQPRRRTRREKRMVPILIGLLIIPVVLLGGFRYSQYDQALKQFISTGNQYVSTFQGSGEDDWTYWWNSYYDSSLDNKPYEFTMKKTNLDVQLYPNDELNVKSDLTIKHNGNKPIDVVFLTLFHGLKITECTSEKKVTCSQEKDYITLTFDQLIQPNEEVQLQLHYQGTILQYRYEAYVEHAFIEKNRVYLPKEAGWYPLIGKRELIVARENEERYDRFELRNGALMEDSPTDFSVNITNQPGTIPLALTIPEVKMGVYQGSSQYGLSLVGGNIAEKQVGSIRVVGHPEILQGAENVIAQYEKGWNFIEDWLNIRMTPSVVYILYDEHAYLTENTLNQEVKIWWSSDLKHVDRNSVTYDLRRFLTSDFSLSDSIEDLHIFSDALEWSISNHLQEEQSFKDWYMDTWYGAGESEELIDLLHAYEKQGQNEWYNMIKFLYNYIDKLEDSSEFDLKVALKQYEEGLGV